MLGDSVDPVAAGATLPVRHDHEHSQETNGRGAAERCCPTELCQRREGRPGTVLGCGQHLRGVTEQKKQTIEYS